MVAYRNEAVVLVIMVWDAQGVQVMMVVKAQELVVVQVELEVHILVSEQCGCGWDQ